MQLYALNVDEIISAAIALKGKNYSCLECGSIVRLREGQWRQAHFYHLTRSEKCRLASKGLIHLNLQLYLQKKLSVNETAMEKRFPEINRIADLVWLPQKIVFEIQYSPISREEMCSRTSDYKQLGFAVVWILHEARFNKRRVTAAEAALVDTAHYYTNFNAAGHGIIYDQFSLIRSGQRVFKLPPLPVELSRPAKILSKLSEPLPELAKIRAQSWPLCFEGDLLSLLEQPEDKRSYLCLALKAEAQIKQTSKGLSFLKALWKKFLSGYLNVLETLLKI